jgi:leader peptidase (prepilin peptidase)/N-methyltransferase
LLTGILFLLVFKEYGISAKTLVFIFFTGVLISLSLIDLHTKLLPDIITLPSIIIGCLISLSSLFHRFDYSAMINPRVSFLGMLVGAGPLFVISFIYYKITGREGLGGGDIKLMLFVGILLGPAKSFLTLFFGAVAGSIIGIPLTLLHGGDRRTEIPFGPYLSAAAWVSMMWGNQFIEWYMKFSGLSN